MTNLLARFDGPIVMIGFGSIGKGTLPLIERHIAFDRSKFVVIAPDDSNRRLLDERQIRFIKQAVTKDNYRELLNSEQFLRTVINTVVGSNSSMLGCEARK